MLVVYMEIKRQLTELFSLPQEIILNLPQVILTGQEEATIENYRSIIEFTETQVRINTNNGVLRVSGNRLVLKHITTEGITITGDIRGIEYLH